VLPPLFVFFFRLVSLAEPKQKVNLLQFEEEEEIEMELGRGDEYSRSALEDEEGSYEDDLEEEEEEEDDEEDDDEEDEDDYTDTGGVSSDHSIPSRAYFGGRMDSGLAPAIANGTNLHPQHEISMQSSSSSPISPVEKQGLPAAAAFHLVKKRRKRSACHSWTSEARASEIVRHFAPDRTSAIFYLFRRIASGGMNKNLRIVPAKRNPPKYSCFFEELGMVSDPDNDSHYHVWAWPPVNSAASRFMATYVGSTELEGVELGGATSDEEEASSAGNVATTNKVSISLPVFWFLPFSFFAVLRFLCCVLTGHAYLYRAFHDINNNYAVMSFSVTADNLT
jgi:hypothetical protein